MNLIVTCARRQELNTTQEMFRILKDMGDSKTRITVTKMPGIITIETKLDPFTIIKKIREKILEEPWDVRYCLRIIPIQYTVETKIESIINCIKEMKILDKETYKISIEKRDTDISGQELIKKIATDIPNKVSLDNPDRIILIEILGDKTGISMIQQEDILSVENTKRSLNE